MSPFFQLRLFRALRAPNSISTFGGKILLPSLIGFFYGLPANGHLEDLPRLWEKQIQTVINLAIFGEP